MKPPEPIGPEYLVWMLDGKTIRTTWIRETSSGYEKIAEAPEAVFAAGDHVWALRQISKTAKLEDCDCLSKFGILDGWTPEQEKSCLKKDGKAFDLALVDILTGKIETIDPTASDADSLRGSDDVRVLRMGSVGPLLMITTDRSASFCGAERYLNTYTAQTLDLRAGTEAHVPSQAELASIKSKDGTRALKLLMKKSNQATEATLVAVFPTYTADGKLRLDVQYTGDSCHADADGEWDDYTVSVTIPAKEVPSSITKHNTPAPLPVIAFWHDNPPPKAAGWTKVPAGAKGALAAFRKESVVSH
jgi:hypothetical protein